MPEPAHDTARTRRLITRFSRAERTLHWSYALLFLVLLLSGLGLYLEPGQNPVLDRRELMRVIHLDAALALVALPLLVAAFSPGTLRRLRHDVEWFDGDDARWLLLVWLPAMVRRRPLPAQGRFNAGQKLNSVLTAAATVGFVVTGALMWQGGHLSTSLSEAADTWHLLLMAAMLPLVAGHLVIALLLPSTRGALRGIVTGRVRLDFARRRHARWAASVEAQGEDSRTRS
jgi:formate dehydrogenase subunit gamma